MKHILKWLVIVLGIIVLIIVVAASTIFIQSNSRLNKKYSIEVASVPIFLDSTSVARGQHIATTRGCFECHGAGLGGGTIMENPAMGYIFGTNLTSGRGGVGAKLQDEDYIRAIRHGVNHEGLPIMLMPSDEYFNLNDDDLGCLIAYLKSIPPVDKSVPKSKPGFISRMLLVTGQLPLLHAEHIEHGGSRPESVEPGVTPDYGKYLVSTTCIGCHGQGLSGGLIPGGDPKWPPASNLTLNKNNGLGTWSETNFVTAMREGIRPDQTAIDTVMPWRQFSHMTDDELSAIWLYIGTLKPMEYGNR